MKTVFNPKMRKLLSVVLAFCMLCSLFAGTSIATVAETETVVKNEFRILADGNSKDVTSSAEEYFESELSYGDLEGVVNTTADGEGKVRVLKAGEANVFKIEIDKDATAIQLNDLKVDSADGAFYQYHFYLSDDGTSFNVIGSYNGAAGRARNEYGNNFSWSKVDQGWIRAQNNKDLVARAPLSADGTKKVLYLKVSSKGGNPQNADDINANAQASYVSFNVQSVVPASSVIVDRVNGDIIDEVRIVAEGNTKDSTSAVTEYFESELAVSDLQGVVNDCKNQETKVRVLTAGQENVFRIEIDKDADSIQINDLKLDGEDGGLFQYHIYLSNDGVNFSGIASYNGNYGRATYETGDNFSWGKVDQGYNRDINNADITKSAPLNEDGTKKVVYLKLSSKGGAINNPDDVSAQGQVAYTSFTVQSVINNENLETIEWWNGWQGDEYADLASVQADLDGSGTVSDPYIVTNADQLYAVIYYGGGNFVSVGNAGTCYKLANDLYLNKNYENYANWDTAAPANKWMADDGSINFNGTIDGDGHTIYGYYNEGSNTALIPYYNAREDSTTIVKNLNMKYCVATSANRFVSFIFAGTNGGGKGGNQIFINNCSVCNGKMSGLYKSAGGGAILGIAGRRAVIDSCAVTDVVFNYTPTSNGGGTDRSNEHSIGSIVGGSQSGVVNLDNYTETEVTTMASDIYITLTNSYAVNNVLNNTSTGKGYLVYPIGIFQSWANCYYCAMVDNVYTDSTTVPTYQWKKNGDYTYIIKLRVAAVGNTTEIPVGSENYPIKNINANDIIGESAKIAMPTFNWALYWSTVENGYPIPEDKSEGRIWDGTKTTSIEDLGMKGTGTKADPYVITNGTELYAAIFSGGNGYYYVIGNDIVLNDDYMNYKNWGTSAPTNKWTSGSGTDFLGHIDGQGYTIYGFYATGSDSGLIPRINNNPFAELVTIENINISHSYIGNANVYDGFIVGAVYWGGSRRLIINGCNVRNSKMEGITSNGRVGGIIGAICNSSTRVNNCSVADVEFTASCEDTGLIGWDGMGAIVGAAYTGATTGAFNSDGAVRAQIINSFAVNCIRTNDNKVIYPIGVHAESATNYFLSVGAKNVYTDADVVNDIPEITVTNETNGTQSSYGLKVASVDNTSVAIDPTSADYPIKGITEDSVIGANAKAAMSDLNWCYFDTVSGGVPVWADNHTETSLSAVEPTCVEPGLTEGKKCSACDEILVEQEIVAAKDHDWSGEWTDTESGKLLTCKNCDESKFKADITVENAHLKSDEGAFAVGTVLTVTKLTEGTDYDAVNAAIPAEPKRAEIYSIASTTELDSTATLMITAPAEWTTSNAVICLLTDNGNLRKMETTFKNGVATTEINVMGVYALIDLSNPTFVGDVDGDGKVTAIDLAALRKYLIGTITAEEIGGTLDVNCDDKVNLADLVSLKKYLVRLEK